MNKTVRIDIDSREYPDKLRNISSSPRELYCNGDISLLNEQSIAIVGSRKFTMYGKTVANMVGKRMAELGLVVVSGLAFGIDGFAHEGMLSAGGKGIAVLGSGINKMTPQKNHRIMEDIINNGGLVISEYPPDKLACKGSFPARNRIISGLCDSLVVIEANYNSGALITANFAIEQGKAVYCVPGNINSQFSLGSNMLIRDGATPLIIIDDIAVDMNIDITKLGAKYENLGEDEIRVVEAIENENGVSVDYIADRINRRPEFVNSIVTVLEIKGILETYGGKIFLAK